MAKCIINIDTINRISNIFPCVAWKDYAAKTKQRVLIDKSKKASFRSSYFDTNRDYDFHKKLNEAVSSGKSDYDIIVEFYNFKNTPDISESREKIFDYLLPPEDQFLQIDKSVDFSYLTAKGIYIFFNRFFVEEIFNKNLEELISTQLPPGEEFPLYKAYDSSGWICYYNNNGPRFTWDKNINWNNMAYSPNTPWEGFEHYCQYKFTLVRIGYEQTTFNGAEKNKTLCCKNGLDFLRSQFDSNPSDNENRNLNGNIDYGTEITKNKKGIFYIKNLDDTILEIKTAILQKKYQKHIKFQGTKEVRNPDKINFMQDKTQVEASVKEEEREKELEFAQEFCENCIEQFPNAESKYKNWLKEEFLEKENGILRFLEEVDMIVRGNALESCLFFKYQKLYGGNENTIEGLKEIFLECFESMRK